MMQMQRMIDLQSRAKRRVLIVLVILSHDRQEILHANVTESPTADWIARQECAKWPACEVS
jgi:hypothetical protein